MKKGSKKIIIIAVIDPTLCLILMLKVLKKKGMFP